MKHTLLFLLPVAVALSSMAQQKELPNTQLPKPQLQSPKIPKSKMPLQFTPGIGMPITWLNKDIYRGQRVNIGQQAGLEIKKPVSKHFSLSIAGQYSLLDVRRQVEQTYRPYLQGTPVYAGNSIQPRSAPFQPSTRLNGIISLNYYRYSKNRKYMFEAGAGGGIQYFQQATNCHVSLVSLNAAIYDTLYLAPAGGFRSAIAQVSVQNTYWFSPCVGISAGAQAQYTSSQNPIRYINPPQQASVGGGAGSPRPVVTRHPTFSLTPTIGIAFRPGGCKQPAVANTNNADTSSNNTPCFGLRLVNRAHQDDCITTDSILFAIQYPAAVAGVIGYEVYLVKENDLNHPKLLFSLAYPATAFHIRSGLLDAEQFYRVFVKLLFRQPQKNCLQTTTDIRRCANCCLDGK